MANLYQDILFPVHYSARRSVRRLLACCCRSDSKAVLAFKCNGQLLSSFCLGKPKARNLDGSCLPKREKCNKEKPGSNYLYLPAIAHARHILVILFQKMPPITHYTSLQRSNDVGISSILNRHFSLRFVPDSMMTKLLTNFVFLIQLLKVQHDMTHCLLISCQI